MISTSVFWFCVTPGALIVPKRPTICSTTHSIITNILCFSFSNPKNYNGRTNIINPMHLIRIADIHAFSWWLMAKSLTWSFLQLCLSSSKHTTHILLDKWQWHLRRKRESKTRPNYIPVVEGQHIGRNVLFKAEHTNIVWAL